jgi:hypothetical protein
VSRFAVSPDQLLSAASSIDAGDGSDATLPPASLAGAAAATPVEGAWTSFLEDAIGASAALDLASAELAGNLRAAATNYGHTEVQAQGSFGEGHRG